MKGIMQQQAAFCESKEYLELKLQDFYPTKC